MITYEGMFTFVIMLASIISLVFTLTNSKKK